MHPPRPRCSLGLIAPFVVSMLLGILALATSGTEREATAACNIYPSGCTAP